MSKYICTVCNVFVFDSEIGDQNAGIDRGVTKEELPDDWRCPVCGASRENLKEISGKEFQEKKKNYDDMQGKKEEPQDDYLSQWTRQNDKTEKWMDFIHEVARTGKSVTEPMRTKKHVVSWDDILIKGAQLAKIPLNKDKKVNLTTIIGKKAKKPIQISFPVYITHMSFGALSREVKIALAKGSAAVKTAMCSGEGGILEDSRKSAYKYIFEYVPNAYSVTDENLKNVDGIEIKIGQSTKPGLGGEMPADKVTEEIAQIRGSEKGHYIESPASFNDIKNKEDLKKKVKWLRDKSEGAPIGIKIAAGHIEDDLQIAVYAEPDFITIDGRPGGTGASPKSIKDSSSVPTIYALYRAKKYFDEHDVKDISLHITGGLRVPSDFVKALALGADAIAIGTAALMACACQQYNVCNTNNCPVGVTTHDEKLRQRLDIDKSAKRLENFLNVVRQELETFARMTGNEDIHSLTVADLCTTNSEISNHTEIEHV